MPSLQSHQIKTVVSVVNSFYIHVYYWKNAVMPVSWTNVVAPIYIPYIWIDCRPICDTLVSEGVKRDEVNLKSFGMKSRRV